MSRDGACSLKAVFQRGDHRVRMVRGLVHAEEQVASRRRITDYKAGIKRAGWLPRKQAWEELHYSEWDLYNRPRVRLVGRD